MANAASPRPGTATLCRAIVLQRNSNVGLSPKPRRRPTIWRYVSHVLMMTMQIFQQINKQERPWKT